MKKADTQTMELTDAQLVKPVVALAQQQPHTDKCEAVATTAATILRAATDSGAGVDVIERLSALYEAERTDMRRTAFNSAMTDAQSEMGRIGADASNTQTRSRYATYAKLDRVLRPIYTRHGFALSFTTEPMQEKEVVRCVCIVSHKDGYERRYQLDMPADGKGAKGGDVMTKTHAAGSATQYGMRYLLKMIFNVAIGDEDDDGNSAGGFETVTQAQAHQLRKAIDASGTDAAKLFAWAKCTDADGFPADKFDEAMSIMRERAKERQ